MSIQKIHNKIINAAKRFQTMERTIEYLRSLNFFFYEVEAVKLIPFKPGHLKYSWLVRRSGSKQDPSLVFGIKMWGKKTDKIIVLIRGAYVETIRVDWKDKADINFRKIVVKLKFPEYLNYDERRKWRAEYQKQLKNPQREPSKWYKKILPDIQHL